MTALILVQDKGPVRVIRMNRPEKKNALNRAMYDAMADALEGADKNIRCFVIAGAHASRVDPTCAPKVPISAKAEIGRAFCAGNDLSDFLAVAMQGGGLGEPAIRFLHALARCDQPLVAAVAGVAIGIGTTMLLHCDHVVAGSDARFSTPFVNLGLVPEAASKLLAPKLMGHRRAFSLLVMGETLDAAGALQCGLVNQVVAPGDVETAAMAAATKIAGLPPEAVAATRALMRGPPDEIVARIDAEADLFRTRLQSPEARAAFEAFFARKK